MIVAKVTNPRAEVEIVRIGSYDRSRCNGLYYLTENNQVAASHETGI